MKNVLLLILFLLFSHIGVAQTQLEMNEEANEAYKKADKELNAVFNKTLQEYQSDAKFIAKLRASQRAWIKFRDAEVEAQFPETDKRGQYGSVYPMCWSMALTDLTKERIKKLRVWLDGVEEADVCAGSIKARN